MILRWSAAAAALMAAIGMPGSQAFMTSPSRTSSSPLASKPSTTTSSSTILRMGPPADPSAPLTEQYGEGSRKYRRTVYTHDQWVKHRSSDRFANNLGSLFSSGIYKQVGKEVFATVSIAVSVCVWNALVGGYQDFSGVMHDPVIQADWAQKVGIPMEAFTILSPSLGLLLVFRTNASYKRWDEARKFWGLNINHTRDLNRMATAWYGNQSDWDDTEFIGGPTTPPAKMDIDPMERQKLLGQVSLMTWAFVRSMKRHLSPPAEDEEDYIAEIESRMSPEQAKALISATHRPNRALYDLSVAIEKLPMHFVRKDAINTNLSIFEDTLGGSERLLSSPVPLFYSRHTARFLSLWLLTLPLGLYGAFGNSWNHAAMIPATAFISVALFGIEELATQLEEPFTILPMQGFCDKIGMNCFEIVSWAGQGQESEGGEEAAKTKALEVETFVPLPAKSTLDTTSSAATLESANAVNILTEELVLPLLNPTILKDVPSEMIQGAAINGALLTLFVSAVKSGPLSLASPTTLIEAVSVGAVFGYVSLTEGRAGDFARGVGKLTMDVADSVLDEEKKEEAEKEVVLEVSEKKEKTETKVVMEVSEQVVAPPEVSEEVKSEKKDAVPSASLFFADKDSEASEPVPPTDDVEIEEVVAQVEALEEKVVAEEIVEDTKSEENTVEAITREDAIENRTRRRMSLRERLSQIEERQQPTVEVKVAAVEEVKSEKQATVEEAKPEEAMEILNSEPARAEKESAAPPKSLSLREIVSQMN